MRSTELLGCALHDYNLIRALNLPFSCILGISPRSPCAVLWCLPHLRFPIHIWDQLVLRWALIRFVGFLTWETTCHYSHGVVFRLVLSIATLGSLHSGRISTPSVAIRNCDEMGNVSVWYLGRLRCGQSKIAPTGSQRGSKTTLA